MASKWSALRALLSVDNTSDMVAISHNMIVCPYPRLVYKREGLLRTRGLKAGDDQMTLYTEDGFTLHSTNAHWKHPCGPYCPEIWRSSYGADGVCKIKWSLGSGHEEGVEGDPIHPADEELLLWRISNRCLNDHCDNARLHDLRKEYVDM